MVHLAGCLGWCDLAQAIDVSVAGTRRVVQAAADAGCTKLVVASSIAAIGTERVPIPPTTATSARRGRTRCR